MKQVHNASLILIIFIFVMVVTFSGCSADGFEPELKTVPTDYLDSPVDKKCYHVERYTFDTPGIDAHEIKTKKKCEELIG